MNPTWQRWALYLSGAWNIIGGASALANPHAHFAQFYTTRLSLDDPLQAFFFRTSQQVFADSRPSPGVPIW